jgi:hypothetical protein
VMPAGGGRPERRRPLATELGNALRRATGGHRNGVVPPHGDLTGLQVAHRDRAALTIAGGSMAGR